MGDDEEKVDPNFERKCYPSSSDIQVFQYRDDPPAYEIGARFSGVEDLTRKLGVPFYHNRTYISAFFRGSTFPRVSNQLSKRFNNYTVEIFGFRVATSSLPKKPSLWPIRPELPKYGREPILLRDSPQHEIHVWRTRVFNCQISVLNISPSRPLSHPEPWRLYLEERWHPSGGRQWSTNWNENLDLSTSQVSQFMQNALQILGYMEEKPKKWGNRRLSNRAEFISVLLDVFQKESNRLEKAPSQEIVAAGMGISRTTFYRRLKELEIPWPPE